MRQLLPTLLSALALGLAALAWLDRSAPASAPAAREALTPDASAPGAANDEPVADPVAELSLELAVLRARVAELERGGTRTAARVEDAPAAVDELAASGVLPNAEERARIVAVLEQLEEQRKHEQELARAEKRQAEFERRAVKVSDALGLPPGAEVRLASVLAGHDEQIALVKQQYDGVGRDADGRRAFKEALLDTTRKRDDELTTLFGPDLAQRIARRLDGDDKDQRKDSRRPQNLKVGKQQPADG